MIDCSHILNDSSITTLDADELYSKTSEFLANNPGKTNKEALETVIKANGYDLLESKHIAKLDSDKAKVFLNHIKEGMSPVELLVRTPSSKNMSMNIETFIANHREDFNSIIRKGLSKDTERLLADANNDLNITKAFDGANINDIRYKSIADNLKEYFNYRDTKLVTSTAFKHRQLFNDYYFRVSHDSTAVGNVSQKEWVYFIRPKLNVERTMQLLNVKTENEFNSALNSIYSEIESGVPKSDVEVENLLRHNIQGKAHRALVFKDLTSQYQYNQQFGIFKSLSNLLSNDFGRSAKQIANSELLGSNPSKFVNNVLKNKQLFKNFKDRSVINTLFKTYYNTQPDIASPTVSAIVNTIRTVSALPRLFGALPFYAIEDIPQRILYLRNSGAGIWESMMAPFKTLFSEGVDKYSQDVDLLRHYVDTFFSESMYARSGFKPPKFLDSASKVVYHGFGLKTLEMNQMKGIIAFRSRQLGTLSGTTPYNKLDPALLRNLKVHGITESDWQYFKVAAKNTDYLTPEQINRLNIKDSAKLELRRKLRSLFLEAANNAVLSNGMLENALYSLGTRPGTVLGESVRAVMQFKSFSLNFLRKILIQQGRNAIALDRKLEAAVLYGLTIIPLSWLSSSLLDLTKGLTPTNPFEEGTPSNLAYGESLLLGNLGSLISLLNPTGNQTLTEKLISSPLTKTLNKVYDSAIHPTHIPKNVSKILNLDNTPIISVLLRHVFSELSEPYKDDSQEYLF